MRVTTPKILLVDDDIDVLEALVTFLRFKRYDTEAFTRATEALRKLQETPNQYQTILLDINMPEVDGFQFLKSIRNLGVETPVIFVSGLGTFENAAQAVSLGAFEFIKKPIENLDDFFCSIRNAVETNRLHAVEKSYYDELEKTVAEKTSELEIVNQNLRIANLEIESATLQMIESLLTIMENQDFYTAGHTKRVREYSMRLGALLQLADTELQILERAALLHDVGKLTIDRSCLQKPGKLTDEEWQVIRSHPATGESFVGPLRFLTREKILIRQHHERVDGHGYPDGLSGANLDTLSKIITIADSFDAMTSKRNYKQNMTRTQAFDELVRCSGTQFDAELVRAFLRIDLQQFKHIEI